MNRLRIPAGLAPAAVIAVAGWTTPVLAQAGAVLSTTDVPLRADRTPIYQVGGMDAPTWAAFGDDLVLEFDPSGNLVILDADNRRVVLVDEAGRHVRDLGREGGGPGEFRRPGDLTVKEDGSVVVVDRVRRRLIQYGADGRLTADVNAVVGLGMPRYVHAHPDGVVGPAFVYVLNGRRSVRTQSGFEPVVGQPVQVYTLADPSQARLVHEAGAVTVPLSPDNTRPLNAFFPSFRSEGLPGGRVALVEDGTYTVTVLGADGNVDRVLTRALPRIPVTGSIRSGERERLLANLEQGRAPEATMSFGDNRPSREERDARFRDRIENMVFPDSLPAIHAIRTDWRGNLWVQRTAGPDRAGAIDVVEPGGRYVGTLPAGTPLPAAFGPDGLVAYLTFDELDVPTIHVARLAVRGP